MSETKTSALIDPSSIPFLKEHKLLPLEIGPPVRVGTLIPPDTEILSHLQVLFQSPVEFVTLEENIIEEGLERAARGAVSGESVIDIDMDPEELSKLEQEIGDERSNLDVSVQAPVIRLVNSLIADALQRRASDIHFEPGEEDVSVRFRIDGYLQPVSSYSRSLHPAAVSRIKIMSRLDIAEKLMPQDGRINLRNVGKEIDVRVSVVPTAHGERVVLRLLDKAGLMTLKALGVEDHQEAILKDILKKPNGVILLTGPTGSGKSTTLYAFLDMVNSPDTNIITLEDPVEYKLEGISQIEVKPRIGFTFASGLRSILRQDPDTIAVGEIRDGETADLAVHAALTGHRVLSTLHTNDAIGAITRLIDLEIQPFLVASSLVGVIAQRLIRKLCECAEKVPASETFYSLFPEARDTVTEISQPGKCAQCNDTGYKGRTGVFEILVLSPSLQNEIVNDFDEAEFKNIAKSEGFKLLRDDALNKLTAGLTTLDEVVRIL